MPVELTGWLDVLACPTCRGPRQYRVQHRLTCEAGGQPLAVQQEIASLTHADRRARIEALPLQRAPFSLAAFNASLHRARDLTNTVRHAASALRPDRRLFVLDIPIARLPRPVDSIGDRHLGRHAPDRALRASALRFRHIPVRRGLHWHPYQIRTALRGNERFSSPIVVLDAAGKGDESQDS
jgi:uncharacterized protein YbaR (Trm112 family)